jgi:tetratricopeptide (TPR) repeat protein
MFEEALKLIPQYHFTLVELASTLYEQKEIEAARATWERAIQSAPDYPISYLFLARMERNCGNNFAALDVLRRARKVASVNFDLLSELASLEIYHSNRPGAADCLKAIIEAGLATPDIHIRYMNVMSELAEYRSVEIHRKTVDLSMNASNAFLANALSGRAKLAQNYNYRTLLEDAEIREASPCWLDLLALTAELSSAIREHRPFSLIRLGDGEGRFRNSQPPCG